MRLGIGFLAPKPSDCFLGSSLASIKSGPYTSDVLRRRDFFKFGLTGAVLSCLGVSCKNESGQSPWKPSEPSLPQPVYELADGHALYDDFDGNGNLQSYDNQNLAEAGKLSSKIWLAGLATEVVLDPAAAGLFSVVNEDGQRVEYGLQERQVQEIVTYLAENPRPVTAFEREVLENLLNDRGKTIIDDVEIKGLEKQAKVIQYVLHRREDLLNDRGRKLMEVLSAKGSSILAQPRFDESFDERELFVLGRILAEKQVYENYRDSPVRTAMREGERLVRTAIGLRKERQEIKYVFDAAGKLVDAVPHIPGQPYHGAEKLLLFGARDGCYETQKTSIPIERGKVYGVAQIVPAMRSGYVLKITDKVGIYRCTLNSPEFIDFGDFKSFSADVMLSSASSSRDFGAGLDYHTTIPEQPPGVSWGAQVLILKYADGNAFIMGQYYNNNLGIYTGDKLGPAQLDKWYNLRLDIITKRDDGNLKENELRLDYYLDGVFRASRIPEDSEILLDPERTGAGPHRGLIAAGADRTGIAIGYFDNVRGVYKNRVG